MAADSLLIDASSVMTVISLATFVGIVWWTFVTKRKDDFEAAARLPFADDLPAATGQEMEKHDG